MALFNKIIKNNDKTKDALLAEFAELKYFSDGKNSRKLFRCCNKLAEYDCYEARVELARFYAFDYDKVGINKDINKAFQLVLPLIEKDDLGALKLGFSLFETVGDRAEMHSCAQKAADLGDKDCCYYMGKAYKNGNEFVEINSTKAKQYYKRAADRGHKQAAYEYASYYCTITSKVRFDYYMTAAEGNDGIPAAMNRVGICYSSGEGVEKNRSEAIEWYKKAAAAGSKWGMYNLAKKYGGGVEGILEQDKTKALELYLSAAQGEDGIPDAMNMVGRYYSEGWGGVKQDYAEAFKWYQKAADREYDSGYYNLAHAYRYGKGCEKDLFKAVDLYVSAAEHGHQTALDELPAFLKENNNELFLKVAEKYVSIDSERNGALKKYPLKKESYYADATRICIDLIHNGFTKAYVLLNRIVSLNPGSADMFFDYLEENCNGEEQNDAEAFKWFQKAADSGYARGYYNLANAYRYGRGCEKDLFKAVDLYVSAAEHGHDYALDELPAFLKENDNELSLKVAEKYVSIESERNGALKKYPLKKESYYADAARICIDLIHNGFTKAYVLLKRVVSLSPGSADMFFEYLEENYSGDTKALCNDNIASVMETLSNKGDVRAQSSLGAILMVGTKSYPKNQQKAFELIKKAADKKYPKGVYNFGVFYEFGIGTEKNLPLAIKKYTEAAKLGVKQAFERVENYYGAGNPDAMLAYADFFFEGNDFVQQDSSEAFSIYLKLADELFVSQAQYMVADYYINEYGVVKTDPLLAKEYYKKAADQGHKQAAYKYAKHCKLGKKECFDYYLIAAEGEDGVPDAMNRVGVCYLVGHGVEKNQSKAIEWYKKAAAAGSKWGMLNLADKYYSGVAGVLEQDKAKAFELYLSAAQGEDGIPDAMNRVGVCYHDGYGVEKNQSKAIEWYKKAAAAGYKWGMYNLAQKYRVGVAGILEQDKTKALELYLSAAQGEDGIPDAMNMVGRYYSEGWGGVKQDYAEAFKWYQKAADRGYASGYFNLAYAYQYGRGCEKDLFKAVDLYVSAAEHGHDYALDELPAFLKENDNELSLKVAEKYVSIESERNGALKKYPLKKESYYADAARICIDLIHNGFTKAHELLSQKIFADLENDKITDYALVFSLAERFLYGGSEYETRMLEMVKDIYNKTKFEKSFCLLLKYYMETSQREAASELVNEYAPEGLEGYDEYSEGSEISQIVKDYDKWVELEQAELKINALAVGVNAKNGNKRDFADTVRKKLNELDELKESKMADSYYSLALRYEDKGKMKEAIFAYYLAALSGSRKAHYTLINMSFPGSQYFIDLQDLTSS